MIPFQPPRRTQQKRKRGRPVSTGASEMVPMGFRMTPLTKMRIEALQIRFHDLYGQRVAKWRVLEKAIEDLYHMWILYPTRKKSTPGSAPELR